MYLVTNRLQLSALCATSIRHGFLQVLIGALQNQRTTSESIFIVQTLLQLLSPAIRWLVLFDWYTPLFSSC
jgi:hypothetical protein